MTTTPTIWKPTFVANATAGSQVAPQTIGLANGNILVVWEDNFYGSGPSLDVEGRMFDAEGNEISAQFQVNYAITNGNETGPKIVALPDGGFVVAYGAFTVALGGFIVVERFNSNGGHVTYNTITDARDSLTAWEITVDKNGNYIVAFERAMDLVDDGDLYTSQDVRAIVYNYLSNGAGPEHRAAQNSFDDDDLAAVAAFASGRIVTLTTDPDHAFDGSPSGTVEFTITEPSTGQITHDPTQIAGSPGTIFGHDDADALDVAVLAGGQFVMLFKQTSFAEFTYSDGFFMRIAAGEAPGSAIAPAISILSGPPRATVVDHARVVALKDGGFYVAWDHNGALFGERFDVNGSAVGEATRFGTGILTGRLALTGDGRILVPFTNAAGEIAEIILDPRESVIYGTALGEVLTTQVFGTDIFGEGGDDTILGQGGNDFIYGGAGRDDLRGRGGADTLFGEAGIDVLQGGAGDDSYVLDDANRGLFGDVLFYDTVNESVGQGTDTVFVRALDVSLFGADGYALRSNVENGVITETAAFNLTGNALANRLTGNGASNTLDGGAGDDMLDGAAGADTLVGLGGNDSFYVDNVADVVIDGVGEGTADRVFASVRYTLAAGAQVEMLTTASNAGIAPINLTGNGFVNAIYGNAGANTLDGKGGADSLSGFGGDDWFHVDNAADAVFEAAGEGNDRVFASVSYKLGAGRSIETLSTDSFAGLANLNLTGNELANFVAGNAGSNGITGLLGDDMLYGGGGPDSFVFNTALNAATNLDKVLDFTAADDTFVLSSGIFTAIVVGTLSSGAFRIGAAAADASDRIVYNSASGGLFYDADGLGGAAQVQFAGMTAGLALTNMDFLVV